jgi:hypothetical protein
MGLIAVLWFIGLILAWHTWGLGTALLVMTIGPAVAAGLFSIGKSR